MSAHILIAAACVDAVLLFVWWLGADKRSYDKDKANGVWRPSEEFDIS